MRSEEKARKIKLGLNLIQKILYILNEIGTRKIIKSTVLRKAKIIFSIKTIHSHQSKICKKQLWFLKYIITITSFRFG